MTDPPFTVRKISKLSYYLPIAVERANTPEEQARIAAAEAEATAEDRAQRERHAWLLAHAPHPILRDLIEAHRPDSDDRWPDCAECPRPPSEHDGSDVPTAWPCDVWSFVSDRMETP